MDPLEWSRIIDLTLENVYTGIGENALLRLSEESGWATSVGAARTLQAETAEAAGLLQRDSLWSGLGELIDPEEPLDRLEKGSILSVHDLHELRRWMDAIESWSEIPREELRGENFKRALTQLPDIRQPLRELARLLTPEGQLSDDASTKLKEINRSLRELKLQISRRLDQLVRDLGERGVLQESFSDVRDGRYVVPVRISAQSEVDGLIHESSASGQTVFIEPKEIAGLNAQLQKAQSDLNREILALLTEASKRLRPYAGPISVGCHILGYWDAVQAKARISSVYGGKPIQIPDRNDANTSHSLALLRIRGTAHPVLWWSMPPEQIIRNDLELADPHRALLITGPNTGGKTVLLKTIGIAAVFARTGFAFPAIESPTVPFFDSIYADLGDPQSIENHLSSFSGHVLRFKEIVETCGDGSLVLLDELNSATDPEEGAALGRAILETVLERGAILISTTHDPRLKAASLTDERILNASMAFDDESRRPSYQIILGIPGRSHALATAERLGIPAPVLTKARSYLSQDHTRMEELLKTLHSDSSAALKARREAMELREEAEKLRSEWIEKARTSASDLLEKTRTRLKRVVETAQDQVRVAVRKLDEARSRKDIDAIRANLSEVLTRSQEEMRDALKIASPEIAAHVPDLLKSDAGPETAAGVGTHEPLPRGTQVRVPRLRASGEIIDSTNAKDARDGKVRVALGTLQMTLTRAEIEIIGPPKKLAAAKGLSAQMSSAPPDRLDLRGKRFDDAMSELEAYLDHAFRSKAYSQVTLVHGLGSGALREGTRQILAKLPYVKSFRDGGAGGGGTGATLVEFDLY